MPQDVRDHHNHALSSLRLVLGQMGALGLRLPAENGAEADRERKAILEKKMFVSISPAHGLFKNNGLAEFLGKCECAVAMQRTSNEGGCTGKGFKKGQSGNPSGKRKNTVSLTARLKGRLGEHPEELDAIVAAMIAGARQGEPRLAKLVWDRLDGPLAEAMVNVRVEQTISAAERQRQVDWEALVRMQQEGNEAAARAVARDRAEYQVREQLQTEAEERWGECPAVEIPAEDRSQ